MKVPHQTNIDSKKCDIKNVYKWDIVTLFCADVTFKIRHSLLKAQKNA